MQSPSLYQLAEAYAQNKKWPEALAAYAQYYREHPHEGVAPLCAMARIHRYQDQLEQAHELLTQALEEAPEDSTCHLELGHLFFKTGQLEHAVRYFQQALKLDPLCAEGYYWLGRIFQQEGHQTQALRFYQQAVEIRQDYPEALNAWGVIALATDDLENAAKVLKQAVQLRPLNYEYHKHLGLSLFWLKQEPEAIEHLQKAIALYPRLAEEYLNLGQFFLKEHQRLAASFFFKLALKGKGVSRSYLYTRLGECAEQASDPEEALYFYQQAQKLKPEDPWLEVRAATLLPWIYQSTEEIQAWNQRYSRNLDYLLHKFNKPSAPENTRISGFTQNFLLAYQGLDNHSLAEKLAAFWKSQLPHPPALKPRPAKRNRIRIGFVSAHFYQHSIMSCFGQLMPYLQANGFDVYCFQIAQPFQDQITANLKEQVHSFVDLSKQTALEKLSETLLKANLDILIYPEIGLENLTHLLSLQRLAPLQCLLAGHPVSSGSPTLDYFISCHLFEPPGAPNHYTEKLFCTQNPIFSIPCPQLPSKLLSRSELGYPQDQRVYLLPESLFKMHPDMDPLLKGILEQDPQAVVVMICARYHDWHEKLATRVTHSLPDLHGRIRFLPWSDQETFFMRLLQADVILDSLHFGAGTVAYQALGLGLPIVTWPGPLMRARIVSGLYQQMGLKECLADSGEKYIEIACRLGQDRVWRKEIAEKIKAHNAIIFDPNPGYAELSAFFRRMVLSQRAPENQA
ncbi:hypothetical protein COW36_22970 [bacterium (Candidatus Blackallbacteria) CG17_big_fil_post_rev_8_21_14_2_50_48_46]|uniref:protein O-GlcNAc transferase n=1 Tax=bacterium (Candidatus Blackallbacteria) CG17_big_fil_post_rev_8_21_14_2_50_48_46 TaxID=2014261 RepID=A0A2M7FXU2_9BACT|nr:MAG: hypothetical protein COW64_16040 [bacterium (Candidatus Blackallbacteria) CG18_big_fil_WC_8_21_14_2_50_49_26]PIW14113.1 MAG: hypothetical protein COW36_22970 [bacterium (Candidatus Blackallbacteria) CG17_big_fil_post_rev_8_21_14_2_50_48_46]PIW45843.1 MAG: hypothetical protein COW20_18635 [bacterium (Candidatus Blackallbacteria) CG13_big_fil_rev_8_21_14_2_50_49_14]